MSALEKTTGKILAGAGFSVVDSDLKNNRLFPHQKLANCPRFDNHPNQTHRIQESNPDPKDCIYNLHSSNLEPSKLHKPALVLYKIIHPNNHTIPTLQPHPDQPVITPTHNPFSLSVAEYTSTDFPRNLAMMEASLSEIPHTAATLLNSPTLACQTQFPPHKCPLLTTTYKIPTTPKSAFAVEQNPSPAPVASLLPISGKWKSTDLNHLILGKGDIEDCESEKLQGMMAPMDPDGIYESKKQRVALGQTKGRLPGSSCICSWCRAEHIR